MIFSLDNFIKAWEDAAKTCCPECEGHCLLPLTELGDVGEIAEIIPFKGEPFHTTIQEEMWVCVGCGHLFSDDEFGEC